MSNVHSQDGTFNPTSPHSSIGLGDSFRGTPDTRLTAFSPEDGSSKSLRAPHSIGATVRDSRPIRFHFGTPHSLNLPREPLRSLDINIERDPFVSSASPGFTAGCKLSPTASCFAPSATFDPRVDDPKELYSATEEVVVSLHSNIQQKGATKGPEPFAHNALSTESGLSRCVVVASTRGGHVQLSDIEQYILVMNSLHFTSLLVPETYH